MQQHMSPHDQYRQPFVVRIDGGDAVDGYDWTEMVWDRTEYVEPDSPRTGVASLFGLNGAAAAVNQLVTARFRAVSPEGDPTFLFGDGGNAPQVARVTGVPSAGLYPAVLTSYDQDAATWADADVVDLLPLNGELLESGLRYLSIPAGGTPADPPVWLAVATCCGGEPVPPEGGGCVSPTPEELCVTITETGGICPILAGKYRLTYQGAAPAVYPQWHERFYYVAGHTPELAASTHWWCGSCDLPEWPGWKAWVTVYTEKGYNCNWGLMILLTAPDPEGGDDFICALNPDYTILRQGEYTAAPFLLAYDLRLSAPYGLCSGLYGCNSVYVGDAPANTARLIQLSVQVEEYAGDCECETQTATCDDTKTYCAIMTQGGFDQLNIDGYNAGNPGKYREAVELIHLNGCWWHDDDSDNTGLYYNPSNTAFAMHVNGDGTAFIRIITGGWAELNYVCSAWDDDGGGVFALDTTPPWNSSAFIMSVYPTEITVYPGACASIGSSYDYNDCGPCEALASSYTAAISGTTDNSCDQCTSINATHTLTSTGDCTYEAALPAWAGASCAYSGHKIRMRRFTSSPFTGEVAGAGWYLWLDLVGFLTHEPSQNKAHWYCSDDDFDCLGASTFTYQNPSDPSCNYPASVTVTAVP